MPDFEWHAANIQREAQMVPAHIIRERRDARRAAREREVQEQAEYQEALRRYLAAESARQEAEYEAYVQANRRRFEVFAAEVNRQRAMRGWLEPGTETTYRDAAGMEYQWSKMRQYPDRHARFLREVPEYVWYIAAVDGLAQKRPHFEVLAAEINRQRALHNDLEYGYPATHEHAAWMEHLGSEEHRNPTKHASLLRNRPEYVWYIAAVEALAQKRPHFEVLAAEINHQRAIRNWLEPGTETTPDQAAWMEILGSEEHRNPAEHVRLLRERPAYACYVAATEALRARAETQRHLR